MKLKRGEVTKIYNELVDKYGRCTLSMLADEINKRGYVNPLTLKPYTLENARYHLLRENPNYRHLEMERRKVILVVDDTMPKVMDYFRRQLVNYVECKPEELTRNVVRDMILAGNTVPVWAASTANLVYVVNVGNKVIQSDDEFDEKKAYIMQIRCRSIFQ